MSNSHQTLINHAGWDAISTEYQETVHIRVDDIHYGPYCHGEKKLQILGDLTGRSIIELGCGGGQNTIAASRTARSAVGVDFSRKQVSYARHGNIALCPGRDLRREFRVFDDSADKQFKLIRDVAVIHQPLVRRPVLKRLQLRPVIPLDDLQTIRRVILESQPARAVRSQSPRLIARRVIFETGRRDAVVCVL